MTGVELHGVGEAERINCLYITQYIQYTISICVLVSRLTLSVLIIIIHSTQAFVSITNLTMMLHRHGDEHPHIIGCHFGWLGQTN